MNILPRDRQIAVIAALSEGMSIRSVERLTGIHRDTIMRLGARVGRACAALHDQMMRDLPVSLIELDELWSYVGKKQRKVRPTDSNEVGDQYVFIALDASNSKRRQGDTVDVGLWVGVADGPAMQPWMRS